MKLMKHLSYLNDNELLSKIMDLNEQQLEDLKVIYQDCIDLANKARENFLMCNQFELDEEKSESYYKEAKRLKKQVFICRLFRLIFVKPHMGHNLKRVFYLLSILYHLFLLAKGYG